MGGCPRQGPIGLALHHAERRPTMEYFAGLDVSMEQTHICVVDRDGAVVHEVSVPSAPAAIAVGLSKLPSCPRVAFETGRMAPMLYHGLVARGVPVVCIESRQARQALNSNAVVSLANKEGVGVLHDGRE